MAVTKATYTGDGSTVFFFVPFSYIQRSDVVVSIDSTPTSAFTFANPTTIEFNTAPSVGAVISISRQTFIDTLKSIFSPGSSITAADLNNNFLQTLYSAQEVFNTALSVTGGVMQGILNMGGFRITNLGAPSSSSDAATKDYIDQTAISGIGDGSLADIKVSPTAGIQSSKLSFTQAGVGAVSRTVDSKLKDVVSVKDFGAVGDGVANDTNAIQAAVAAAGNKLLLFPAGVYSLNFGFNLLSGTTILGYGATIDFSQAPTKVSRIRVNGTIGSNINLSANGDVDDTTISVTSASDIAPGDLILISSNKLVLSGNFGGSIEAIGEIQVVESVVGNVITLKSQLRDSYLLADAGKIAKITPNSKSTILGLKIIGSGTAGVGGSTEVGITSIYSRNLRIQDVEIINCDYNGISVDQCYNTAIEKCRIEFEDSGNENVIQYGVTIKGASEYTTVNKCEILRGRHGVAWSENPNPGVCRNDIISENLITNTKQAAIATHTSNQNFIITNNTINQCVRGIDIRVYYGTISNNRIVLKDSSDSQADGIILSRTPHDLVISGNSIDNGRFGVKMPNLSIDSGFNPYNIVITSNVITNTAVRAIYLQQTNNPGPMTGFTITNNTISECVSDYINLDGEFEQAIISGNQCRALTSASTNGRAIKLQGTSGTVISNNHLLLHESDVNAIRLEPDTQSTPKNCDYVSAYNNIWESSAGLFSQSGATNFTFYRNSRLNESSTRSILAGVIEAPYGRPFVRIGSEGSVSSDDLDTISGGTSGDFLACYSISNNQAITFKDGTGNLRLNGDFTTTTIDDVIFLLNAAGIWLEVSRSTN